MPSHKGLTGLVRINGIWHIDKLVTGYGRLCESTKASSRKAAESYLIARLAEIEAEKRKIEANGGATRRKFEEAALRYVEENRHIASIEDVILHLTLTADFVNRLPLDQVHDGTLKPFIDKRRADGVKASTINHSLEVVRRVLNAAARRYRDNLTDGSSRTWLAAPPLITMLAEQDSRNPYPLSWEEQDYLLRELPAHLQRMALFKVNTGTREQEVCELRWSWEVRVTELEASVFVVPSQFVKNREDRLIVLNRVAASVIEQCRGDHREFVFVYRKNVDRHGFMGTHRRDPTNAAPRPVDRMNNTSWQGARLRAANKLAEFRGEPLNEAFACLRVHDLKHTFGRRLRAAGVSEETRKVLLGHTNGDITTHYSAPEVAELIAAANLVSSAGRQTPTLTVLRTRKL
jgi:integrase